jgi:pimeloyl-ACP methyl ester carboxylesterase
MRSSFRTTLLTALILGFATACAPPGVGPRAPAGEHSLHLRIEGGGGPGVVFEAGLGDGASVWKGVAARLPGGVRRITYDRPGYGGSRPTAGPRDPASIARELHQALHDHGVPPPYLLVGHSLGGLHVQAFARLFPGETAGLVLVDPTHPDQWARMAAEAPADHRVVSVLSALFPRPMRREFEASKDAAAFHALPPARPGLPVTVLSAEEAAVGESARFTILKRTLQAETAAAYPGAGHRWVRSSHYIQKRRPEAVAQAITDLLARTPAGRGMASAR